jgi:hypothetical protein
VTASLFLGDEMQSTGVTYFETACTNVTTHLATVQTSARGPADQTTGLHAFPQSLQASAGTVPWKDEDRSALAAHRAPRNLRQYKRVPEQHLSTDE